MWAPKRVSAINYKTYYTASIIVYRARKSSKPARTGWPKTRNCSNMNILFEHQPYLCGRLVEKAPQNTFPGTMEEMHLSFLL